MGNAECTFCGEELTFEDYYGKYLGNERWHKTGEIYVCENEDCSEFMSNFYVTSDGELFKGYPV